MRRSDIDIVDHYLKRLYECVLCVKMNQCGCLVLLLYFLWSVSAQDMNMTHVTWRDASKVCRQDNKAMVTFNTNKNVPPVFKRDHKDVLRKSSMWVGNYIRFQYHKGTDYKSNIDITKDQCIAAKFARVTAEHSLKYAFVLMPRNCTDMLQPACSKNQGLSRVDQNSTDWFQAAELYSLWSPEYIQQPLATNGALANGTITLDSNKTINDGKAYWIDLVKEIHLLDDSCPITHADLHMECGYVELTEPKVQYGDCFRERVVICENSTDNSTDMNISRCIESSTSLTFTIDASEMLSAVYIGVSVGSLICLIAVVVVVRAVHQRRSCTKVDTNMLKLQSNVRKKADDKSYHPTSCGTVDNATLNLQMIVNHTNSLRAFDDNTDGIAYASFNEYQPTYGDPGDFNSDKSSEPVCYGATSGFDQNGPLPADDSEYYPVHGQFTANEYNAESVPSNANDDNHTGFNLDKGYKYMDVKNSRLSVHVPANAKTVVDLDPSHDGKMFTVQNYLYASI